MATFQAQVLQQMATIRANQTQTIIPDLVNLLKTIVELSSSVDHGVLSLINEIAILNRKLDAILVQIAPPETGDFDPENATITKE